MAILRSHKQHHSSAIRMWYSSSTDCIFRCSTIPMRAIVLSIHVFFIVLQFQIYLYIDIAAAAATWEKETERARENTNFRIKIWVNSEIFIKKMLHFKMACRLKKVKHIWTREGKNMRTSEEQSFEWTNDFFCRCLVFSVFFCMRCVYINSNMVGALTVHTRYASHGSARV